MLLTTTTTITIIREMSPTMQVTLYGKGNSPGTTNLWHIFSAVRR
jgi:hypothetical protein